MYLRHVAIVRAYSRDDSRLEPHAKVCCKFRSTLGEDRIPVYFLGLDVFVCPDNARDEFTCESEGQGPPGLEVCRTLRRFRV